MCAGTLSRKIKSRQRQSLGSSPQVAVQSKAAVLYKFNSPLVIETLDIAGPGAGQALVRLSASGVCHTQLAIEYFIYILKGFYTRYMRHPQQQIIWMKKWHHKSKNQKQKYE